MQQYGAWCLVPPLVVVALGIISRRSLESLLVACLVGCWLINAKEFPNNFVAMLTKTLQNADLIWVILVCGIYGMIIQLVIASGGAVAFGVQMQRYIKTKRAALGITWLTGVIIFVDDYLSALSTGLSMRKITDRFGVPRALLAYIVNTTAAPICVLVPISTWGIYVGSLLEQNKVVAKGHALQGFVQTIPYNFYAIAAVALAFLMSMGKLPLLGKMRKAKPIIVESNIGLKEENNKPASAWYFILPMLVLIVGTIALGSEALKGAMVALVFTAFLFRITNIMSFSKISETAIEGFKSMIMPLAILSFSFFLKSIGDQMHLTDYVILHVKELISPKLLPVGVFIVLSVISYTTCSSWGMYAIALPIIIPLSQTMGINIWLSISAVVGAGVVGSNASFFSDCTILTATSTETSTVEHSFSQLPYALMAFALACAMYILVGFWG
jgi:tetracycline resistance efflux pump